MANTEQPTPVSPEQAKINANAAFAQFQELYNSATAQKTALEAEMQRLTEHMNKLRNDHQLASNQATLANQSIVTLQNVLFFQPPAEENPGPVDDPTPEAVAPVVAEGPDTVAEAPAEAPAAAEEMPTAPTKAKKVKI